MVRRVVIAVIRKERKYSLIAPEQLVLRDLVRRSPSRVAFQGSVTNSRVMLGRVPDLM